MSPQCRILYIDDDKDSRDLVSFMLDYLNPNFEIICSDSAESAISLMASQNFDLYIIDYALPEISGIELCRRIRKNNASVPVLFFTAMARPLDRAEGLAAGADEYLVKPNDLDKLTETVKRLLDENSHSHCVSSIGIHSRL